jgi:hypothetical protein
LRGLSFLDGYGVVALLENAVMLRGQQFRNISLLASAQALVFALYQCRLYFREVNHSYDFGVVSLYINFQ